MKSTVLLALAVSVMLVGGLDEARAVLVRHNGTIVFHDDFDEGYDPGFDNTRWPIPWIGSWGITGWGANQAISVQVLSAANQAGHEELPVGGAAQGSEYLRLHKTPAGGTIWSYYGSGFSVTGGVVSLEFMCYLPVTNTWNAGTGGLAQFRLYHPGGILFMINANRTDNEIAAFPEASATTVYRKGTTEPMTWTPNAWQEWKITYTFADVGEEVVLTLDGVESEPTAAYSTGTEADQIYFRMNGASDGSNAYLLDATEAEARPRLVGHYNFVEPGSGPWAAVTDKAGPVYYSSGTALGGGNVNIVDADGYKWLDVNGNADNVVTMGQGQGDEFNVDYAPGPGFSLQMIFKLPILDVTQIFAAKYGQSWKLWYGANSNIFFRAMDSSANSYTWAISDDLTADDANKTCFLRAELVPNLGLFRMTFINLEDAKALQDIDTNSIGNTNMSLSASSPLMLGAQYGESNPNSIFQGMLRDIRIRGEGYPPIPTVGTVITVK